MHPIPVRRMEFEIPTAEDFDPKCVSNDALASYALIGLSLYVAYLEPFLVKSMRRVLDQITDDELRECVDRFSRQEAQHYMQHERFNEAILGQEYPGLRERFARLKADFDGFLEHKGDRWCVGFVEGFEAYTTQSALEALNSRSFHDPRSDQRFARLMKWHLTEEIEHRNVAFDIYEHLYGDYPFRVKMCWIAQWHIWLFILDVMKIMSPVDVQRRDVSYRVTGLHRVLATVVTLPKFLKTYTPWYTPHDYVVPDTINDLSAELIEAAKSVS